MTPSYIATAYRISALKSYHHLVIELGRSTITLNIECPQTAFQVLGSPSPRLHVSPPLNWPLRTETSTLWWILSFSSLSTPQRPFSLVSFLFPAETRYSVDRLDNMPYFVVLSFPATLDNSLLSTSPQQKCLASSSLLNQLKHLLSLH